MGLEEPRNVLNVCDASRFENFLEYICAEFEPRKASTITTYWRWLSQLFIVWYNRRIFPTVLKRIEGASSLPKSTADYGS
jgi:hypothetical protein